MDRKQSEKQLVDVILDDGDGVLAISSETVGEWSLEVEHPDTGFRYRVEVKITELQ